jgi:hypothetical protein
MRFVVEVTIIGGGLHGFLRAFFSGGVSSIPVVSMFISVVLTGAKNTAF